MRPIATALGIVLLFSSAALLAEGQEPAKTPDSARTSEPPEHFYRLDFVVQEVSPDGKPTNSRSYSTTVSTARQDQFSAIRTGSRVPIITGAYQPTNGDNRNNLQYQYIDVGVNIDTQKVHEVDHQLAISLKAEITTLADTPHSTSEANHSGSDLPNDPVIRQNMWQSSVMIPIGKQSVAFASDALESKGEMRLLVTATPLQ